MTESSFPWPTTGSGDVSPISVSDSAALLAAMLNVSSLNTGAANLNTGVLSNMLNLLAPTVSGTTVLVASGWGLSDGHFYRNTASKTVTPALPTIGVTGRRLVLRTTWAGGTQTTRLTEISSADGTATIPAMTQTPGVTFDVPICEYTVANGTGAIASFVDDRVFFGAQDAFTSTRTLWRQNRYLVAEFAPQNDGVSLSTGLAAAMLTAPTGLAAISGEMAAQWTATGGTGFTFAQGENYSVVSPSHSLRLTLRFAPPAASANVTVWLAGLFSARSTTPNGVYIRIVTTGHPFFVTRQGGSETTFDMGSQVAGTVIGYEIDCADAGVTWVLRNQLGTVIATQTTNVPTAATALGGGVISTQATAGVAYSVTHARLEGAFA